MYYKGKKTTGKCHPCFKLYATAKTKEWRLNKKKFILENMQGGTTPRLAYLYQMCEAKTRLGILYQSPEWGGQTTLDVRLLLDFLLRGRRLQDKRILYHLVEEEGLHMQHGLPHARGYSKECPSLFHSFIRPRLRM